MAKDSSELRFRPSSPRYGHFSVSARGTRPGPKRAHLGSNGHRFGVKRVQTQPKADPNVTQLHSMQQQRQPDLTLGPEEALGPVFGVFGPFRGGISPGGESRLRPRGAYLGSNGHRFGGKRVQTWPKADPNVTQLYSVHQQWQPDLPRRPMEAPRPVFGILGPFLAPEFL